MNSRKEILKREVPRVKGNFIIFLCHGFTFFSFLKSDTQTSEVSESDRVRSKRESNIEQASFTIGIRSSGNDETHYDDEEYVDDGTLVQNEPGVRRSTRNICKRTYLDDYILVAEIECERLLMVINDEPWNFNEAKELHVWIDACKDEILSIEKNDSWELVDLPLGVKPIDVKWVFKIKRNVDGSISKYKAHLIAKGYVQRHNVDYDEVFVHVARIKTFRLIISLAAYEG